MTFYFMPGAWTGVPGPGWGYPDIPVFRALLGVTTVVFLIAWKTRFSQCSCLKCLGANDVRFFGHGERPSIMSVTLLVRAMLEFKRKWPEPDLCIGEG